MMRFSIITATRNSAATIEDALLSVADQDYPAIEHIIVDGNSTDDTLKIIEKHSARIAKVITGADQGIYNALNRGIEAATGDVIGILHSDDIYLHSSVISEYAKVFVKESCDAVYADLMYVDRKNPLNIVRSWKSGDYLPGAFLNGWMPPHPTFFLKRSIYLRYGVYREDFRTAADYELMLRMIHKNRISVCYLPVFAVKMRTGGASNESLAARLKANMEDRRAWRVNGLKPRWFTLLLKPVRKIGQYFR